jgi:hypothetical protein
VSSDIETTQPGQAADGELLAKLIEAVAAANGAEQTVATAQVELVSRSRTVGLLLLEAKKLHPAVKDFETFLQRVQGLKLSRAYDLLRLAGGRTTDEQLRKEARERQAKSREKKKLSKPEPALPKPEPKVSVTVTETTEPSAEECKAECANDLADLQNAHDQAKRVSARCLAEFTAACRLLLPKMTGSDRQKARELVLNMTRTHRTRAEAA